MAVLEKIVVQDWRNIALAELSFSPNVNCIWGRNGAGKTNLLDAIFYLSMTKSAFAASDRFCFRHGTQAFALSGTFRMGADAVSRFSIRVEADGEKKLRRDDKPIGRIADHIGTLPVVMVSPSDSALVSESGEDRRRFLNAVLSQMDRSYLADMQLYNRLLAQRNRLLKSDSADPALLDVFDARMGEAGARIYAARARFAEQLGPVVARYYGLLSGLREGVSVGYRSDLAKGPLEELLRASRERDAVLRYTSVGIQRDDLDFQMDGHPIRRCGSQGQQKSFLVALKFAQYDLMKVACGFAPMLLLDDVFDKLDRGRIEGLLGLVAGDDFGQIFLTDTNAQRLRSVVDAVTSDRAYFETADGLFTREEV